MKPLLTAFGPFQSRPRNGSATLLAALRVSPGWGDRADYLFLPVAWNSLEFLVAPAVAKPRPWALGLGEGKTGRPALELRARNLRTGQDESGAIANRPWESGGPEARPSRVPKELGETSSLPELIRSQDAGAFLCNGLLWTLLVSPVRQAAFLHLPPQGETSDETYAAQHLPTLHAVLEAFEKARSPGA